MSNEQILNSQNTHDAAAYLYWMLAEKIGVTETCDAVVSSGGKCLFEQPFSLEVLNQHGVEMLTKSDRVAFQIAIAHEAENHAIREVNMNGTIYIEDAEVGRSPSAENIDTSILKVTPPRIIYSNNVEKVGTLCLRHPLPSVVFLKKRPSGDLIEVGDTTDALGFHLPMFIGSENCSQVGDDLFLITGIFHIPVPDRQRGNLWNIAIQNSSRFVDAFTWYRDASKIKMQVIWRS